MPESEESDPGVGPPTYPARPGARTERRLMPDLLVAGIGNIFLGDDGFGPEVVRHLAADPAGLPEGVRLVDYGIRGMHLAYDLLAGYDALVLVDAVPGPGPPGELTVLEIGPERPRPG